MATIRFRSGKWQAQVRLKTGPQMSKSFHLKADAQAWARTVESDIQSGRLKVLNCPETLADILNRYLAEVTVQKRGVRTESLRIKRLLREPFVALKADKVTPAQIASFRDKRLREVGPQAVRHDLNLLGHAIKIARVEWGLELQQNPVDLIKKPAQPPSRTKRLKPEEMRRFKQAVAEHPNKFFQAFITLAIETGMRQGELLKLTWENVDLERSEVFLPMTKNGLARAVPLTPLAKKTIQWVQSFKQGDRVLPLTVPLLRYNWDRLIKRTGAGDFHMHDLRREAVSRLFELGLSIPEVAAISGHQDLRMVQRYTKMNTSHLVEKLSRLAPDMDE